MQPYQIRKMTDFSEHQIEEIRDLEQLCKDHDKSGLRVGVESLKQAGGDEAFLCHMGSRLIGFLSWYTSDGAEANLNGMVHPDFRRKGVFTGLLKLAQHEMLEQSIRRFCFRVPSDSKPGVDCLRHWKAEFRSAQFSMIFDRSRRPEAGGGLIVCVAGEHDFDFMVQCCAQAFGDPEDWTRNYLARTNEPERATYIAMDGSAPVGMIRINFLPGNIAVVHDFCVLPSYQGRGLGREILDRTVTLLLENPANLLIRLSVVTENEHALRLYQSAGFTISAESHYYVIS